MSKLLNKNQTARLPEYLSFLNKLKDEGQKYVSTQEIANALSYNNEKVKKDFQDISSTKGIPNKGREIDRLIKDIKKILGFNENHKAILIGCGHLGQALLNYNGFKEFNLEIVGGFDVNKDLIGKKINNIEIYDFDDLQEKRRMLNATIGILCVPGSEAKGVALRLVSSGIQAIWNFSPVNIDVNDDIIVSNMNMAQSLANLAHRLYIKKNKGDK